MLPPHPQPTPHDEDLALLVMLMASRSVVALTGAGISTESGIPDYRGPLTRKKLRHPMRFRQFMAQDDARRRYWARAFMGWPTIDGARPNLGHRGLAALERVGIVETVITQNVDGLHQRAGSRGVLELHGTLSEVECMECAQRKSRSDYQAELASLNPQFAPSRVGLAPDGDVDIEVTDGDFVVAACSCGGFFKPRVVFFGENAPTDTVARAYDACDAARALLVVGTSLEVYSARRFVLRAQERQIPICIVNLGETRMDDAATLRIDAPAGHILNTLSASMVPAPSGGPT